MYETAGEFRECKSICVQNGERESANGSPNAGHRCPLRLHGFYARYGQYVEQYAIDVRITHGRMRVLHLRAYVRLSESRAVLLHVDGVYIRETSRNDRSHDTVLYSVGLHFDSRRHERTIR